MVNVASIKDFLYYRKEELNNKINHKINRDKGKIYFSQHGEDTIVEYLFKILRIHHPSYIDIGAHDPFFLSNTALLYTHGSHGINVEPDPSLIEKFEKHRKRDINLNIGITDIDGEMDFYVMNEPSLNTFSKVEAERLRDEQGFKISEALKIKTCTLPTIINKYCNGVFPDFLSIDTEGYELPVLRTIDWSKNSPKVICCETRSYGAGIWQNDSTLTKYIESKGYRVYADTQLNKIFLNKNEFKSGYNGNKEEIEETSQQ